MVRHAAWASAIAIGLVLAGPRVRAVEKKALEPPIVGTAMLKLIEPELDDFRACHQRAAVKDPSLGGEVVVHAIVEGSGKVIQASPYGVSGGSGSDETAMGTFKTMSRVVAPCIAKRIAALPMPAFPDGMGRKVVIAFRFAPTVSAAPKSETSVHLDAMILRSEVFGGRAITYAPAPGQVVHRWCWKVDGDREGCAVRFLTPAHQVKKELPIYKPGEGTQDADRNAKENQAALRAADTFDATPMVDLPDIEWPDDAAAMVLPDIGVALSAAAGHIDVARVSPDGKEIRVSRIDLRGARAAHLVAVHWALGQPVVVLSTRRPASAALGDPAGAVRVSDLEFVALDH